MRRKNSPQSIRPVLAQNCAACHDPAKAKNPVAFLKATTVADMEANRGLWRNVAAQMRNRTMPPTAIEADRRGRFRVAPGSTTGCANRLQRRASTPARRSRGG